MNRSDSIAKLLPALIAARAEMNPVVKDATNPQYANRAAGKDGAYATLAACLDACEPALGKHRLAVLQTTRWTDGFLVLDTVLAHESGEWIACEYPVMCDYNQPQKIGGGVTYARRYSYLAITGTAPEDDDGEIASGRGNGHGHASQPAPAPARPINAVAARNLASHRNTGQRGHLQEAPAGWGNGPANGNGNGHAKPAAPPATTIGERVPVSGSMLYRWACECEQQRGPGMMAFLTDMGVNRGWGKIITKWTRPQVDEAFPEARDAIELIYDPHADEDSQADDAHYDHEQDYN